ncbi:MAG: prepilin-type cleavage/methylation-like protein [Frankiales bacterium]|nr:prepilin-type cleavage/methylation-like protein [Frankiales bacterium]
MRDRLRRIRDRRQDAGLTLVELLVAMVILSVVTAVSYSILITVSKQSRDISGRQETVTQLRNAVEQMDRQIRSGNVLYDPANETSLTNGLANSMRVYTQTNGLEKCVQWQLLNGTLRSRSWSTTWQTDSQVSNWATVARGITNSTSPFTLDNSTAFGSRLINISFTAKDSTAKGSTQTVQTSLSGRNTEYGYDTGVCSPLPAP